VVNYYIDVEIVQTIKEGCNVGTTEAKEFVARGDER
jgi:hypothetical protein